MSRVMLPGYELLVLGQNTQLLDALVAEYNRQAVNTGAGHPGCETFLENFHSLRRPESADSVGDGGPVCDARPWPQSCFQTGRAPHRPATLLCPRSSPLPITSAGVVTIKHCLEV